MRHIFLAAECIPSNWTKRFIEANNLPQLFFLYSSYSRNRFSPKKVNHILFPNVILIRSPKVALYLTRAVRYGQKIYITIFFSISILITILTNRHALSHILLVFAHLVLHILFCTFLYSITHFTLLFFTYIYIYICSCVVLLLYNFYSLHCPLSGPDLIYISLLIIPCIIYHVTNKETLTFTVINAFCVNLKHISKGNQLDLSQKVVTCL